jgi:hypothetical protein
MAQMVLNRNFRMATRAGHVIFFHKDTPTSVPKVAQRDALSIGAEFVDPEAHQAVVDELEAPVQKPAPLDEVERQEAIFAGFAKLEARNERGDFNAAGAPTVRPLSSIVGFEVDSGERTKLWNEYRHKKAEAAAVAG